MARMKVAVERYSDSVQIWCKESTQDIVSWAVRKISHKVIQGSESLGVFHTEIRKVCVCDCEPCDCGSSEVSVLESVWRAIRTELRHQDCRVFDSRKQIGIILDPPQYDWSSEEGLNDPEFVQERMAELEAFKKMPAADQHCILQNLQSTVTVGGEDDPPELVLGVDELDSVFANPYRDYTDTDIDLGIPAFAPSCHPIAPVYPVYRDGVLLIFCGVCGWNSRNAILVGRKE